MILPRQLCALAVLCGAGVLAGAETRAGSPYDGDIALYPKPEPVASVQPSGAEGRDAISGAIAASGVMEQSFDNGHVRVRVRETRTTEKLGDTQAAAGHRFLLVALEWTNVSPRVLSTSSKPDRTMGAGSLFGGKTANQGADSVQTELDVAYKVPGWANHLFAVVDGIARAVHPVGTSMAAGAGPDDSLTLGRFGQRQQYWYAFEIPSVADSLALYFFDYTHGNVVFPLTGTEAILKPGKAYTDNIERRIARREVDLAVAPVRFAASHAGITAPDGWKFAVVDLVGKSLSGSAARGDIVQIDAARYAWLIGDGGYHYPAMQASTGGDFARFTPEVYKWDQFAFLVPDSGANFAIGLRFDRDVSLLPVSATPAQAAPQSFAQYDDGNVMRLHVFGQRRENDRLIVDLGAEAMAAGKGIELSPYRQFSLTAQGASIAVDKRATQALAHGAASAIVVPPANLLRFSLAFDAPEAAVLNYTGLKNSGEITLVGAPQAGSEVVLPAMARVARQPSTGAAGSTTAKTGREPIDDRQSGDAQTPASAESRARVLEAITLAPLLKEGAAPEQEPNDEFEQASEIAAPFKVTGRIKGREADTFRFRVEGEGSLWTLRAEGATLNSLSLLGATQRDLVERRPVAGEGSITISDLYLLPGWHWARVRGKGTVDGEYVFQAVPGAVPDPASEREPNDDKSRAQRLQLGQEINGLNAPGDTDYYRFTISAPALIEMSVQPAVAMTVNVSGFAERELRSKTPGDRLQHEAYLDPGDYVLRVRFNGKAAGLQPYRLLVNRRSLFAPEGGSTGQPDTGLAVALGGSGQVVRAFSHEAQGLELPLTVTNNSGTVQEVALQSRSSHHLWRVAATKDSLSLQPGQTARVPVKVEIGAQTPAGERVSVAVQATTAAGATRESSVDVGAECRASAMDPHADRPLPNSMWGGLNLAWASLGAYLPAVDEKFRKDPARYMGIIDGYTPLSSNWDPHGEFPLDTDVQLATRGAIIGVTIDPTGCDRRDAVRDFELHASLDGSVYEPVIEGTVSTLQAEQAFLFPNPVVAQHLRLRTVSTHRGSAKGKACVGEFKAIADPDTDFSGGAGWNIANPQLGGHVVWSTLKAGRATWDEMLADEPARRSVHVDPANANEWVIGFHHNRAAQLQEIRWHRQLDSRVPHEFSSIDLSVSLNGPFGPWQSIAVLAIDSAQDVSSLRFAEPVWARYVRFSSTDPEKAASWQLPARLQIIERPVGAGYRSMLGEWGHYSREAAFEFLHANKQLSPGGTRVVTGNSSRAKAHSLQPGTRVAGEVQRASEEDWYRLSVPPGQNRLQVTLFGAPHLLVEPELIDSAGGRVALEPGRRDAVEARYSATVVPGDYLLRVFEPNMSTIVSWDNSGSVSPYATSIYQALDEFARGVKPPAERVNFLPFQDKNHKLLSEEWTDQPFLLAETINNYDRGDTSSYAEANLLAATKFLEAQPGNKMVLLLTDAASGNRDGRQLWQTLARVAPHVFTVELHGGGDFVHQQDKMQDWADASGGLYANFRTQSDLDLALEKALCTMRRPVAYGLQVDTRYQKPRGPGTLQVSVSDEVAAASAVEIILDASGSMYRKIGDRTRIDIARTVLTDLLQTTVPSGTPFALRIYGHREPRSCRTDLELSVQPLVTADALRIIQSVDPQDRSRTPLAESLKMVAEDLQGVAGPKLVILLTDGEESCDGDPEEAVRFLQEQDMDVRLNIVGMSIESDVARRQFIEWARIGGGLYFDADSDEALQKGLERSLFPKYQLIDGHGEVVVEAVADGGAIEVAEGAYKLKVLTTPSRNMGQISIEEGKNVEIVIEPE